MQWTECSDELPDSERTVITYAPDSNEPVWPGYHDGEQWVDINGQTIDDATVTHWMDLPEPPEV